MAFILEKRLRSQVSSEEKELVKKMKLEKEKEQKEWENRPFIQYKGKLKYHTDMIDCAMICDTLLEHVKKRKDIMVVGFDMEWPFSFQTGSGKTAVIQISPELHICYILHVTTFKRLPKSLTEFLIHPRVRLTGNNIKNDVRKLARDFSGLNSDRMVENCIDIGVMANSVLPLRQRWSLEKLVDYILKMKINKDNKVRRSKWHVIPLTREQQKYAAIDAYASLLIYQNLKEMEQKLCEDLQTEMQKEQDQNTLNVQIEEI